MNSQGRSRYTDVSSQNIQKSIIAEAEKSRKQGSLAAFQAKKIK